MKKLLSSCVLLAALVFAGCTVDVDLPGSKFSSEAVWTTRTLKNVRYYNSDVNAVSEAAIAAGRAMGLYYAGDTPTVLRSGELVGRELFFCGPKFVKITVDVNLRRPQKPRDPALQQGRPYSEVAIVWDTWGDLDNSKKFVSGISRRLPSEADRK